LYSNSWDGAGFRNVEQGWADEQNRERWSVTSSTTSPINGSGRDRSLGVDLLDTDPSV